MKNIICVIPAYNEEKLIASVIKKIPDFVKTIIVVNDGSSDNTKKIVEGLDNKKVILINHNKTKGVGGAVKSGYKKALELKADYIVKIDGDDQMDTTKLKELLYPLINQRADFTKGVRFRETQVIKKMPLIRLVGNLALSFFVKMASGYWNVFDPTNGYTAINGIALKKLDLSKLKDDYFFEISMLTALYKINAVIEDVEMSARYGDEKSSLSITKTCLTFPYFLFIATLKRILWRYFIYDFSVFSVYFVNGILLSTFGLFFGAYKWYISYVTGIMASTGTVMIPVLSFIVGFQLLIQAAVIDTNNVPRIPLVKK